MTDRFVTVPDSLELPAAVKVPSARLSDSGATGRAALAAADAAALRAAAELGSAATTAATDYATAAQGDKADAADVDQIVLTGNLVLTIPAGHPAASVYRATITQTTGGHMVTYGGQPVTVDTAPGGVTTVELHPAGAGYMVRYPADYPSVPTSRTVAGKALTGDVTLAAADVGALDGTLYASTATSGAITINPAAGGTQTLTLTGAASIALGTGTPGTSITLIITQGTGAPHAVTWDHRISWQSAPVMSATAGLVDVLTFVNISGWGWYGFVAGTGLSAPIDAIVDTFTRADAASLGTTETGQPWTSTNWSILNNRAMPTVGDVTTRALVDTTRPQDIRVSCKPTSAVQYLRLTARCSLDGSTYYRLVFTALAGPTSYIQRNNGTGFVKVGVDFSLGAVVGDRVGFSVTFPDGVATIKAYRNDTEVYSITDSAPPPAATYAGMIALSAHAVDDFRVDYL